MNESNHDKMVDDIIEALLNDVWELRQALMTYPEEFHLVNVSSDDQSEHIVKDYYYTKAKCGRMVTVDKTSSPNAPKDKVCKECYIQVLLNKDKLKYEFQPHTVIKQKG